MKLLPTRSPFIAWWVALAWLAVLSVGAGARAQGCEADTGAGADIEGVKCVEMTSAFGVVIGPNLDFSAGPPLDGEAAVMSYVMGAPGYLTTATDLRRALGLVHSGGLVLSAGGEFRQAVGIARTYGIDRSHPFSVWIGYRSYQVDAWRSAGDGVGTIDDPFGPGWRASWGDLLIEPSLSGGNVVRIDEHGASWSHTQVSSQTVPVGPLDNPTTWRIYDSQAGTRLVLEYYYIGSQVVPIWFREWPDRTRCEYAAPVGSNGNLVTKRLYRGSYSSPDWEVVFTYDTGSGKLNSIQDARGIQHTLTWTSFGSTRRVTKITTAVPASWSPNWSSVDTDFEYHISSPYQLIKVLKPARAFLEDQNRNGAYDSAESYNQQVVRRFAYEASSNKIAFVYDESTGLARQMLEVGYDTATSWRVATLKEGESSSLVGQGQRTHSITYPQANRLQWTDPRGVVRKYDSTTAFGSSPRQWKVTRIEEVAGANDLRPTSDPNYHTTLVWQFAWACACGQLTEVIMPSGLKHVMSYDSEGRGLLTSMGIIPAGGSTAQQVRAWTYRTWNDADYRLASRLSGYTNALSKVGSNTFTFDGTFGGYRVDGTFAGVPLFSVQEDSKGRVLWSEEASFQVDGASTSHARIGYTVGTSATSPSIELVTAVNKYQANGTSLYSASSFSYEGLGWLKTITDERGYATTISHDTIGQVTSVTMPTTGSGRGSATYSSVFSLQYTRRGDLAKASQSAHDDQGAAYTHSAVIMTRVYDYFSRPWIELTDTTKLSQSTGASVTTTNEYDDGDRLVRVQQAGGRETRLLLDDHDQLYQERRKLDSSTWSVYEHGYHADGVVARIVEPTGLVATVDTLDGWGRPQRVHFAGSKHLYLTRDNEDRLTESQYRTGTTGATLEQTLLSTINDFALVVTSTLSAPNLSTTTTIAYTYNGPFRVATAIDGDGRGATFGYDARGRLVRKQDRLLGTSGNAEVFTRDVMGNITRIDFVEQRQTGASSYASPIPNYRVDLAYDAWSRLARSDFYGSTSSVQFSRYHGYDSLNNGTWSKDGVGKETRAAFDSVGRMVEQWFYQRNASATPVHLTLSHNDAPSNALLSAILTRSDGVGNVSQYHYDLLGRLVECQFPGYVSGQIANQWINTYDLTGRLTEWRDGNGTRVEQLFDAEKRLSVRRVLTLPTNGVQLSVLATHETWAYDNFDRVASAQTWWGTYPQISGIPPASLVEAIDSFDGIGRQTLERFRYLGAVNKDLTYGYAKSGGGEDALLRRSMSTSASFTIGTTPDGAGKLASMTLSGPSITSQALAEWRYEGGRAIRRSHLPGTASTTELITDLTYNAMRHMTQATTSRQVGSVSNGVYDLQMERDNEGHVTQHRFAKASGTAGDWFSLDGWDRLQEVKMGVTSFSGSYAAATVYDKKITYALDEAHNRSQVDETVSGVVTSTTYTLTASTNQYSEVAMPNGDTQNWLYDGNGNLLSDGYYLYVYDHLDRMSEAYLLTYPGGGTDQTVAGPVVRSFSLSQQRRRDGKETVVTKTIWQEKVAQARQRIAAARTSALTPSNDPRVPMGANAGTASGSLDEAVPVLVVYYGYDRVRPIQPSNW